MGWVGKALWHGTGILWGRLEEEHTSWDNREVHVTGRRTRLGKVEGQRPNKGLCDQGRLHGNRQASGSRGGRAHQAFVTRGGIVPRAHCDVGPCRDPGGSKSLQRSLPGEQLSEEAAASLEAATSQEAAVPLGACGQCLAKHPQDVKSAAGECSQAPL